MADYYPLLARALKALPDPDRPMRQAVYDRARQALLGQLRSLEPPLSDADIEHERVALDAAIGRLENEHDPAAAILEPEPVAAPAEASGSAVPAPAPPPAAPPPSQPDIVPADPARQPDAAPVEVLAPHPSFAAAREAPRPPPEPERGPQAPDVLPPGDRNALPEPGPPAAPPVIVPARPRSRGKPAEATATDAPAADDVARGQRPRIDVKAPSGGRARLMRNLAVALVLLVVIGLIAVAAWALRDKPSDLAAAPPPASDARPSDADAAKYADRVGGERPSAQPQGGSPARAPAPSPAQPGVTVAQRALLVEENPASPQTPPTTKVGRVVWRLDAVNAGQGQPLETVVRATIEIPDANGFTVNLTMRRNAEATLPASHTIELVFSSTGGEPNRTVRDVGLPQLKEDENGRGSPLVGLPVPVRDNVFLLGLSNLPADIERNTDLLKNRPWIDLPIRYASGGRAILSFEKGTSGERVIDDAFAQWR